MARQPLSAASSSPETLSSLLRLVIRTPKASSIFRIFSSKEPKTSISCSTRSALMVRSVIRSLPSGLLGCMRAIISSHRRVAHSRMQPSAVWMRQRLSSDRSGDHIAAAPGSAICSEQTLLHACFLQNFISCIILINSCTLQSRTARKSRPEASASRFLSPLSQGCSGIAAAKERDPPLARPAAIRRCGGRFLPP